MDRRTFVKGALLSSVALPASLSASRGSEKSRNEDERDRAQFARVILTLLAVTVIVTSLLVKTDRGYIGVDLRSDVPVQPAEKLSLRKVPLIGGLFEKPLFDQFAGAPLVGTLFLIGTTLILLPIIAITALSAIWITHRKNVFKPERKPRRMKVKTELTDKQIKAGKIVGRAVLKSGILLAIVGPGIFDNVEFKAQ